jgi:hypothetical protein
MRPQIVQQLRAEIVKYIGIAGQQYAWLKGLEQQCARPAGAWPLLFPTTIRPE